MEQHRRDGAAPSAPKRTPRASTSTPKNARMLSWELVDPGQVKSGGSLGNSSLELLLLHAKRSEMASMLAQKLLPRPGWKDRISVRGKPTEGSTLGF